MVLDPNANPPLVHFLLQLTSNDQIQQQQQQQIGLHEWVAVLVPI